MIFYALSVALILSGCFAFYKIFLQQETFFPLNRFVLLTCLALSFSLPLIPVPEQWSFRKATAEPILLNWQQETVTGTPQKRDSNTVGTANVQQKPAVSESIFKNLAPLQIISWIYWLGVTIFGINFLVQLVILLYRVYSKPFIQDGKFRIVEVSGEQAPCSFANNIFINPEKYDWDTYSQIILHEKIHIQQGHSYDIIFAELALVFQWFNPFAWLYRKAMEDNLEFLTDNELLQHSDVEPTSYQLSLVKVSAPNFPASLTTNYNQSVLKKRLMMMNAKKSNINSTWKYVCIVPLMLIFIALLNEPIALGKGKNEGKSTTKRLAAPAKGTWFATIKKDKINIRFENEGRKDNSNSTDFELSAFKALPRGNAGTFELTRAAGTITFTGKFEGNAGMGNYEFNADETFLLFLEKEGVTANSDEDAMVYFMVDLQRNYIAMLKSQGFTKFGKSDLIPLAALKVSSDYINSLKKSGIQDLTLQNLVPLKALNIDAAYVADIKKAGSSNLTADRLITLKAQGIDGDFIKDAKAASGSTKAEILEKVEVVSNATNHRTDHKTNGDDDEDVAFGMLIAKKALNVTAEYAKAFSSTNLNPNSEDLVAFKALGITAEYVKSFEALGLKDLQAESFCGMKALGLTAAEFAAYKKLGFTKLSAEDVISAKATGTTPTFISTMKKKGHNFSAIDKYVAMKVTAADED